MLKILDLDGFKYVGDNYGNYKHVLEHSNFRKNCTYIHLITTDWEKDKEFLSFLGIHIKSIITVKYLIQKFINEHPKMKRFHIVIKQDDDDKNSYGFETISVTPTEPEGIKKHIAEQKEFFEKNNYKSF